MGRVDAILHALSMDKNSEEVPKQAPTLLYLLCCIHVTAYCIQEVLGMKYPPVEGQHDGLYRLSNCKPKTSNLDLQTSDLKPRVSNLDLCTSPNYPLANGARPFPTLLAVPALLALLALLTLSALPALPSTTSATSTCRHVDILTYHIMLRES